MRKWLLLRRLFSFDWFQPYILSSIDHLRPPRRNEPETDLLQAARQYRDMIERYSRLSYFDPDRFREQRRVLSALDHLSRAAAYLPDEVDHVS